MYKSYSNPLNVYIEEKTLFINHESIQTFHSSVLIDLVIKKYNHANFNNHHITQYGMIYRAKLTLSYPEVLVDGAEADD